MKLDFNSFPLNIYNETKSQSLLESINADTTKPQTRRFMPNQLILTSIIGKVAGTRLLSLIDEYSIGRNGVKARKCLSRLINEQMGRIKYNSSTLLEEAQVNLMVTSCITSYLGDLESKSFGLGARNLGKVVVGLFSLKNPLDVLWESAMEVTNKYVDICQVYFIAFLLVVYNAIPDGGNIVRRLITESLCNDGKGETSFLAKERPILFSNSRHKSLQENLTERIGMLSSGINRNLYRDLYDPFIMWRMKFNAEKSTGSI